MIKTARQLKDLIRNLSKDKAADAQILMRNYMMERFLERISLSEYRDKFILKGGMLVAAMVGLDARSTMDIDATVDGMGRGAGNCALELLLGFLKNPKYQVAPILKIIEEYTHKFKAEGVKWGYDIPYLLTGQYNTHPRPAIQFVKEDRQDYYKFSNELYDIINS